MPDDSRLNRQFELYFRERRKDLAANALAEAKHLDALAICFFAAIDDMAQRHPDYGTAYESAVESMKACWHDAKADLDGEIKRDL